MPKFNEAQIELLEKELKFWKGIHGQEKPPRAAYRCSALTELDPGNEYVTPQCVGRYYAARVKALAGKPRMQQKTPEQLALLEASFVDHVYPSVQEIIRLIGATGLKKSQISAWFQRQRKILEENDPDLFYSYADAMPPEDRSAEMRAAKVQWIAYKKAGGDVS